MERTIVETTAAASTDGRRAKARSKYPLQQIEQALEGLRYGHVTLVVQDGVVVMIERTEKNRLV
ncbi:YezD family protein [Planctomicrobium piriforme]|uniref:Uncharacterized small protein n=1 Tax=Planctomicrobium piriforme TaxID=1576369 RepID=A0A1I3MY18_9PLAN|nr:YezD family protein [Planctomicrobium piriforme]SFJ01680.1 Uncharacterized small protein [Planctomicrobium piriforme]